MKICDVKSCIGEAHSYTTFYDNIIGKAICYDVCDYHITELQKEFFKKIKK